MSEDKDRNGGDDGTVHVLEEQQELRFEATADKPVTIKLLEGRAECFGSELVRDREYVFTAASTPLLTWHGCKLMLRGPDANAYTSAETNATALMNTHAALEAMRETAHEPQASGPRVIVIGGSGCGKTSIAHTLINYCTRSRGTPILVDLDPYNNTFLMPGCVSAAPILRPSDPIAGFSQTHSYPLMYHYGHTSIKDNRKRFDMCMELLAASINKKLDADPMARASGVIINTPTYNADMIITACKLFQCDAVLVVEMEKYVNEIKTKLKAAEMESIAVLKLPKSSGVVPIEADVKETLFKRRVREYFYGNEHDMKLEAHSLSARFTDMRIFKLGLPKVSSDCLPIGDIQVDFDLQLAPLSTYTAELSHRVLSVLDCDLDASDDVIKTSPVRGFISVETYYKDYGTLKLFAPASSLCGHVALTHDFTFVDALG